VSAPDVDVGTLRSTYDDIGRSVSIELEVSTDVATGWQLAFTSLQQLTPVTAARLVERLGSYHVIEPVDARPLGAGERWSVPQCAVSHRARHANDGPVSAYLIASDGSTHPIEVAPMTGPAALQRPSVARRPAPAHDERPALLPFPGHLDLVDPAPSGRRTARLEPDDELAAGAWQAIASLTGRRGSARLLPTDAEVDGASAAADVRVTARIDERLGAETYRMVLDREHVAVDAGDEAGLRHAFVTLAQWLAVELPTGALVVDRPRYSWRGLHVDLARQWFEPDVVDRLIDEAAWRKLSRLHLHLTDDEAWRIPVEQHPELADVAARRGHGLPLPPMLGGGADPVGRAYTPDEIAGWVARADELGVVLVPEIDLPGHLHAALTAIPSLRDPDDRSDARSVQYFVDNVLVPGVDGSSAFLEHVVDAVASLFPSSPWIHVGGDEVPDGAWRRSPVARRFAHEHAITTTNGLEAAIHREVVDAIRARAGRAVGAWEEVAHAGGAGAGDGYVVGWRSVAVNRELAALGFDVVVAPGQAYYLDMAVDDAWSTPGMSWAGSTSLAEVCAFDPEEGWTSRERAHLLGVQACVWTEHVHDEAALRDRLFPRLDAIAERAWTGTIVGGPSSLARRSELVR
jgi:hexosaminidase